MTAGPRPPIVEAQAERGSARELSVPERVEEIPEGNDVDRADATPARLERHADVPLHDFLGGRGPKSPQVPVRNVRLPLGLDRGVICEDEVDLEVRRG